MKSKSDVNKLIVDIGETEISSEAMTSFQNHIREWAEENNVKANQTARCTAGVATFYFGENSEQRLMDDVDNSFRPKLVLV